MRIEVGDKLFVVLLLFVTMVWGYFFGCTDCGIMPPEERITIDQQKEGEEING